ncbi:MAG: ROK family protein [Sulfobacillus benefaciens]|uniref:ROK family protein n=1 Tax=Sulfobacillus benefaciens TaxID=453960 RepID=A0A2T2WL70_9FIRM|nr:MAG: ROK family protein [Sulfobacillus benefaciens]
MKDEDFVLGMDFGGTKTAIATADARGEIILHDNVPTLPDAEQAVSRALEVAQELVSRSRRKHGGEFRYVGVATMGITQETKVLFAPNVNGWEQLQLPRILRMTFGGIPIVIANDVKSAAVAELKWGALRNADPGLFVNLGTGIAAALCVGGRVIQGAQRASGEIAYNPLTEYDVQGVRSGVAPFEEIVGGGWIKHHAREQLGLEMGAGDILRQSKHNPTIRAWIQPILRTLAFQLTSLVIALNPARVVIGGGLSQVHEVIFPSLLRSFEEFVPFPPELTVAHFQHEAGLMGAIALALGEVEGYLA